MSEPPISVGADVFVREPQRFEPGCTCIVGTLVAIDGEIATIDASIGRLGGGDSRVVTVPATEIRRRFGTPLSELSGRPGSPGYQRFVDIASSWGFE